MGWAQATGAAGMDAQLGGQDSDAFTAAGKRPLGSKDQSLGGVALLAWWPPGQRQPSVSRCLGSLLLRTPCPAQNSAVWPALPPPPRPSSRFLPHSF